MKPERPIQIISSSTLSSGNKLAMHRDSHSISKPKPPKIRIIHVFAPEIIKTDAGNFRELVQRLTGKKNPDDDDQETSKTGFLKRSNPCSSVLLPPPKKSTSFMMNHHDHHQCNGEEIESSGSRGDDDRICCHRRRPAVVQQKQMKMMKKESEEMMIYGGSFLNGFGEIVDCFNINELVGEFPLLPFNNNRPSHIIDQL